MKYLVMIEDSVDALFTEIEADSPLEAANKFVDVPDNGVEDKEVIIVAEKLHKFEVSTRATVHPIVEKPKPSARRNNPSKR